MLRGLAARRQGQALDPGGCAGTFDAGLRQPAKKSRFKNRLPSFDASVTDPCVSLFHWAQFQRTKGAILSDLALLRQQLFVHRELWAWLDEPFQPPPGLPDNAMWQLTLLLVARVD